MKIVKQINPKPSKTAVKLAQQVQRNKKALLVALEDSLCVVTAASRAVGLDRTCHYRYMNDDPAYAAAVRELENVALDFAESELHKQILKGEVSSTIFYLKTKGKGRGYVERQEIIPVHDSEHARLRALIATRAREKGISEQEEMRIFVNEYADKYGCLPEVKERLASELIQ